MSKELFRRYVWLVDVIYRNGRLTFKEIDTKWQRNENLSAGEPLAKRTFHNHKNQIQDIFDIVINCDEQHRYYIENSQELEDKGLRNWLLNTFSVAGLINESYQFRDKILFEQIPSGEKYLTPIIRAIRDNNLVEITYQSYFKEHCTTFAIEPYCVKVFKQRWYVVGKSPSYGQIRIYALDRIKTLIMTDEKYIYPKEEIFDPQSFFDNYFGIIADNKVCSQTIKIKVYGKQRDYLRALPLHYSQRETEQCDTDSIFEYRLCPTYDFYQELLSLGENIEVLEPQNVREEIYKKIEEMAHRYAG